MLEAVPEKNLAVDYEKKENCIVITVHKKKPKWLFFPFSWLFRVKLKKKVMLDSIGTEIWQLCDGINTVEKIVTIISEKYELTFHESRVAVTEYLKMLIERGIVAIRVKD